MFGIVIFSWMSFIGGESKFIYYPFAVKGWGSVGNESFWQDFYSTPWYELIGIRVVNFFIPITPLLFPSAKMINTFYPIALQLHKE